ncbi:MAG: hypothetical protein CM15mP92_0700 [Halieaceae bacterium]|nr:MAG: hypothetical protein CM15mP92_0700 [Halieaceae bacterium]
MVGGLYSKLSNDKRDMGFYIFYMGINIGAATASIIVGYVGEELDGIMDLVWQELEWLLVNYFIGEVKNI